MQQKVTIKLLPSEAASENIIRQYLSSYLNIQQHSITGFKILKRSIDARSRQVWILLSILVFIDEPFSELSTSMLQLKNVSTSKHQVVIVGAGPAGLFAAIKLIENGIRPVILER